MTIKSNRGRVASRCAQKASTLGVWRKTDPIFKLEGARAFQRDRPDADVHLYATGHFAMEEELAPLAAAIEEFYERRIRRQGEAAA